jgi:SH3-like domain-containing protein
MTRNALAGLVAMLAILAGQAFAESPRPKQRPDVLVPASAQMPAPVTPAIATMARPALGPAADPAEQIDTATAAVQPAPAPLAPRDPNRGAVSNLPLPRYVTLKTNEGNARRGPGLTHRIDWVFTRAGMPLKITAEHGHWRRIEDAEGIGGWVHYSLLSGVRSVLIKADMQDVLTAARPDGQVAFRAEAGVIARLLECAKDWCRISVDGEKGWVPAAALWGVAPGEVVE